MRQAALLVGASVLMLGGVTAAHGTANVTPTVGYYEAHLGGNKYFTFGLYDYRFLQVDSMAIEERHPSYWVISGYDGYDLVHGSPIQLREQARPSLPGHGRVDDTRCREGHGHLDGRHQEGFQRHPEGDHRRRRLQPSARRGWGSSGFRSLQRPVSQRDARPVHVPRFARPPFPGGRPHVFRLDGRAWRLLHVEEPGASARVVGHWTSAHDVVGGIFDQHGVEWEFHASLQ